MTTPERFNWLTHEINNPLTIILGNAAILRQALERDRFKPELAIERLKTIEEATLRISGALQALLTTEEPQKAPSNSQAA